MAAGCASPAYVPRSAEGIAGWFAVKPFTCISYTTVSAQGVERWEMTPKSEVGRRLAARIAQELA